jgi:lipopolysaccharide biosynthesis protein
MGKTIICHLFNADLAEDMLNRLQIFNRPGNFFFFNVQENTPAHQEIIKLIRKDFPSSYILQCPHKGRDIGAKLTMINLMLLLNINSEHTLIIHDKKSLYSADGKRWANELSKIIAPGNLDKVDDIFKKNEDVGIVCSVNYIQNEYVWNSDSFLSNSNSQIKTVVRKYQIKADNYDFVAGNIFWIRSALLKNFFKERSIPMIKTELERNNILDFNKGTFIHAWERVMSWIATSQGQRIYGI